MGALTRLSQPGTNQIGLETVTGIITASGLSARNANKVKGAFYREWRLVSMDGTALDVPYTKENLAAFKKPKGGRGKSKQIAQRFM